MKNDGSRAAGRILPKALGLTGAGLVGGGMLLAVIDVVRFLRRGEELTTPDGSLWWTAAVLVGAIVLGVVAREGTGEDEPGPAVRLDRKSTVLLVVASVLLLYVSFTAFSSTAFSWTASPEEYHPDPTGVSLWAATLAITLGTALLVAAVHRPRLRPWRGSVPPLAGGLVVVLLLELGLGVAALHRPTEHTISDTLPDAPAPVPSDISEVGWRWQAPQGVSVQTVEPGPFGPLLVLKDGVVALDGSSGEMVWSYRHPYDDEDEVRVMVSDGGTRALITREPVADRQGDQHVTEVDTATGRILREFAVPPLPEEEDTHIAVLDATSQVRLVSRDQGHRGHRIGVHAVDSNDQLWTPTIPEPHGRICSNFGWEHGENLLLHQDQVLITYSCVDEERLDADTTLWDLTFDRSEALTSVVVAFDARTGEENWVREWDDTRTELGLALHLPVPDTDSRPVVVVQGRDRTDAPRVLDLHDGSDTARLPAELMESQTEMSNDFEDLLRADSQGTVLLSSDSAAGRDGDHDQPYLFQRVSASGEITDTAQMPYGTVYLDDLPSAVALAEAVVVPHLEYEETGTEQTIPAVVVVPSGAGPDDLRILRFDEPEFTTDPTGMFGTRYGHHRAVPVPGAVVTYVWRTATPIVYGLVG